MKYYYSPGARRVYIADSSDDVYEALIADGFRMRPSERDKIIELEKGSVVAWDGEEFVIKDPRGNDHPISEPFGY